MHIEGWLCHPGKLCDSSRRQSAVSVPLDRFEYRLKKAMPRTFLIDLARHAVRVAVEPTSFHRKLIRNRAKLRKRNKGTLGQAQKLRAGNYEETAGTTDGVARKRGFCTGLVHRSGQQRRGIEAQAVLAERITNRYVS
jgi:hypothetical protein